MKSEARKAAIAACKERKIMAGVYLVRCQASGEIWVGQWLDLEKIQTRLWFALRHGAHPNRALLDAWRRHGESHFSFDILEKIDDETTSLFRAAELKERADFWRDKLGAGSI